MCLVFPGFPLVHFGPKQATLQTPMAISQLGLRLYASVARSCNSCNVLLQNRRRFATAHYNCCNEVEFLQQYLTTVATRPSFCNSTPMPEIFTVLNVRVAQQGGPYRRGGKSMVRQWPTPALGPFNRRHNDNTRHATVLYPAAVAPPRPCVGRHCVSCNSCLPEAGGKTCCFGQQLPAPKRH